MQRENNLAVILLSIFLLIPQHSFAQSDAKELANLGIEDLMQLDVSSVSRKDEKVLRAPAAIFVLSNEDIRRSGATNIPEALRLVPGLFVAHINGNTWAISSRGFAGEYANKLLVLIDGRSVYTPLFSGVFWDVQDVPLEDIERIEVIRGPGATLWGANAVSGVINIITKSSSKTKGTMFSSTVGDESKIIGTARYGDSLSENSDYRFYMKYLNHDDQEALDGESGHDSNNQLRGGFRSDTKIDANNDFTIQGDMYDGESQSDATSSSPFDPVPTKLNSEGDINGGNILTRWNRIISPTSNVQIQLFYDRTMRDTQSIKETRNTTDGDLQYRFALSESHDLMLGVGYRFTESHLRENGFSTRFTDNDRSDNLVSSFIQDDITLSPSYLKLILGTKFEHNDYTGFEYQPNARILFTPTATDSIWASVSRAIRSPSQAEATVKYGLAPAPENTSGLPGYIIATGNEDFESEDVLSYEVGYRSQITPRLAMDFALFYDKYDGLRGTKQDEPFVDTFSGKPYLAIPYTFINTVDAYTYGSELSVSYKLLDYLTLKESYSFIQINADSLPNSVDQSQKESEGMTPQNQLQSWISLDLPANFEVDGIFRYYDSLATANIGSYWGVDVRVGYKVSANLELSFVGQNLLDSEKLEFVDTVSATTSTKQQRAYYGKIVWNF